ncbi:unnamed protein product [Alopecurus aequalis]
MLGVNVLLMGNAILMGVMVGIGAYRNRYRHHPLTGFFFMGATTLFLPIVSYIMSITESQFNVIAVTANEDLALGQCDPIGHAIMVLLSTALVQIIGVNTTAIVAADDREAGRSIPPPPVLLVQAVWTSYLGVNIMPHLQIDREAMDPGLLLYINIIVFTSFALIFAKIFLKYYAWYSAKQSFSFGRNPRLVAAYIMEHLPADDSELAADQQHVPPPLIVSREDTMLVGKDPHGYRIMPSRRSSSISRSGVHHRLSTTNNKRGCLVTMDNVWELDGMLLKSTAQLKDVCFSFALFKMLRCRFARYSVTEADGFIRAGDFLWQMLLEDSDGTRTLGVIATELSFLQDYHYSSLPITYSKDWLPISSIFISLCTIGCCLLVLMLLMLAVATGVSNQIDCQVKIDRKGHQYTVGFGNLLFDMVPLLLVDALVVLSEVREIASYVCSDWTKVALICRYISWREYPNLRKWICLLLRPRCKLVRPWKDNMNQCSIIVLHPRKFRPLALLRRIIPLPDPRKKVKVPKEVKAAIVDTLRSSSRGDDLRNGKLSWQQLGIQVGDSFLQAGGAQGTSDTLLAWHIATTIFETRNPPSPASSSAASVAMHLSRYCAYLVAYSPELLPDHEAWSSSLYKATKKGAEHALRDTVPMATPELEYRQLVNMLSAPGSKHEVLQEGARLGEQLVELMEAEEQEEEAAWNALAGFWCEIILNLAPSDNLDGHALAVARGGELITLLWALLTHVGVAEATAPTAPSSTTRMGASPDVV